MKEKIKLFKEKNKYLEYNNYFNLEKIDLYRFYELIFKRNKEVNYE